MHRIFYRVRSACARFKVESADGVAAIEYGLMAALIAAVIITAVTTYSCCRIDWQGF